MSLYRFGMKVLHVPLTSFFYDAFPQYQYVESKLSSFSLCEYMSLLK